jgi:WD40 repeat protein
MTADGNLASSSLDHTVKVWSSTNGSIICNFNTHTDTVDALLAIPSIGALVSGSSDGTVKFWMSNTCSNQGNINYGVRISALYAQSISNCWYLLAGSKDDGVIRILSFQGFTFVSNATVTEPSIPVTCVIMLPILFVVSGHSDGSVHVTNPFQNGFTYGTQTGHTQSVTCLQLISNYSFLSAAGDGMLKAWHLDNNGNYTLDRTLTGAGSNIAALVMLSASKFLSAHSSNVLSLWIMGQSMSSPTSNETGPGMNFSSMVANYYVSSMFESMKHANKIIKFFFYITNC